MIWRERVSDLMEDGSRVSSKDCGRPSVSLFLVGEFHLVRLLTMSRRGGW